MSANTEKCADKEKAVCDYNEFRRLRYFHGMLLDDKGFQSEQQYHAGKRRLINRMLHGSGVVCGLDLKGKKDARWIEVTSGLALDCSGNEIWVPKAQRIDLASLLPPKDKPKNAECKETPDQGDVKTYYIGIRYEEKPTDPVSVYLPSSTCEERTCENSRYKEGYCIEVVDCCPEKYPPGLIKTLCDCEKGVLPDESTQLCHDCGEMPEDNDGQSTQNREEWCKCVRLEEFCESSLKCPECCSCEKPCYVVLGQIKVKDCRIQSICMNECRKYVLTGRMIQHLLLGVFAGSEELLYADVNGVEVPLPEATELVHNPIKALCWVMENLVIKGGDFNQRPCRDQPPPSTQTAEQTLRKLEAQVKSLGIQQTNILNQINEVRTLQQQAPVVTDKVTAAEKGTKTEKETTAEKETATTKETATKKEEEKEDTAPLKPPKK